MLNSAVKSSKLVTNKINRREIMVVQNRNFVNIRVYKQHVRVGEVDNDFGLKSINTELLQLSQNCEILAL